jgi:long-chain acyl-CoA synthetase
MAIDLRAGVRAMIRSGAGGGKHGGWLVAPSNPGSGLATEGRTALELRDAARAGMTIAVHARSDPHRPALWSADGDRSFDELNARANQLARALRRRGLGAGDGVALVCANRPEFAETAAAVMRAGMRLTPVNWHLTAAEIAYILEDCEARALVGDARFAHSLVPAASACPKLQARLALRGGLAGFEPYEQALGAEATGDLPDPSLGSAMLYTSGTTGRPKGVYRPQARAGPGARLVAQRIGYRGGEDRHLCTGPLYHAAPLGFSLNGPLLAGVGVVLMDGWDAERSLALVERHRVTHTHMVPTMFHRLLALPEPARRRHDLSSLRMVLHGAAPCPVAVKRELIAWLGPIVYEYYAATEGWGAFVTSEEWLARPGTVGRPEPGSVRVLDDRGRELPPGEIGLLYLSAPEGDRFRYFNDDAKTRRAYDAAGTHFTLGDVGYLDAEGWLYLADRSADVIITGGVNVYPAEVDAVLLQHPAVADAATVGVPDDEWGESVRSVVQLRDGYEPTPALAEALRAFCRERLAHFKCPRAVDWSDALPRHDTGKLARRLVRDRYWEGRERRI